PILSTVDSTDRRSSPLLASKDADSSRSRWSDLAFGLVTLGLGLWLIVRPLASLSALVLAIAAGMVVAGASRLSDSDRPLPARVSRSEEHTSELQSRENLVCRLLLEKKKETMRACASGR